MRVRWLWGRRRLTLYFLFYFGIALSVYHIYNSKSVKSPSFNVQHWFAGPLNHVQIIGSGDEYSLPLDADTFTFNNTDLDVHNDTKYKIIATYGTSDIDQSNLGGCPDFRCRIVQMDFQSEKDDTVDAFIFHGKDPSLFIRRSDQYAVFFTLESPEHWSAATSKPSMFNLTMGYPRDADLPCPYGYFIERPQPVPFSPMYFANLQKLVKGKMKLAALFVSNCGAPSGRLELANELRKYNFEVDIFGSCGTKKCPKYDRVGADIVCNEMLEKEYKFYFAFENSICHDYISEKFWEKITLNVVVVVLSRRIVEKYVPPHSVISADDFDSPAELANYLLKLHNDDKLYLEYFKWREYYRAIFLNGKKHDIWERPWGLCRLCKLLWTKPPIQKVYEGFLSETYWSQKQCYGSIFDLMEQKRNNNTRKLRLV